MKIGDRVKSLRTGVHGTITQIGLSYLVNWDDGTQSQKFHHNGIASIEPEVIREPVQNEDNPKEEILPDHLEIGLHSPAAASNLRSETADEYDRRRDFEEDGDGSYYPSHGDIRGFGGRK